VFPVGAEFDVLPRMIELGTFCNIDLAFVEVHYGMRFGDNWVAKYRSKQQMNALQDVMAQRRAQGRRCRGYLLHHLDDESYFDRAWDGGPNQQTNA
jgi:hypothetical protein